MEMLGFYPTNIMKTTLKYDFFNCARMFINVEFFSRYNRIEIYFTHTIVLWVSLSYFNIV